MLLLCALSTLAVAVNALNNGTDSTTASSNSSIVGSTLTTSFSSVSSQDPTSVQVSYKSQASLQSMSDGNSTASNGSAVDELMASTFAATSDCPSGTYKQAGTYPIHELGSASSSKKDFVLSTVIPWFKKQLHDNSNKISIQYKSNNVVGYVWAGAQVNNAGCDDLLSKFYYHVKDNGIKDTVYMQHITNNDPALSFGIIINTKNDMKVVQDGVKQLSMGKAIAIDGAASKPSVKSYMCTIDYPKRKKAANDETAGTCVYKRMKTGGQLDEICGVSYDALKIYNPDVDFTKLQPDQPMCCSEGKLPDLRPKKNKDGSCYAYTIGDGENCKTLQAKYYPLSEDDLMKFNKDTYGWYGCNYKGHPWKGDKICLSDGTPPKPTINPEAECGPLSKNNTECPLNACCSKDGFCGETEEYCKTVDSPTNAPGTTGCFSNCGTPKLPPQSGGSQPFKDIKYYMTSDGPLKMDPRTISADVLHFGFVNIVVDGDGFAIDENSLTDDWTKFLQCNTKRVASFGGWDFSTNPKTYNVFRQGVTKSKRDQFANMFVDFANKHKLDGLDFDWEYPGAPDIPGIPADSEDSGENYLEFLKIVRSRIGEGKTISVSLPASFWYLKHFPVEKMQDEVDYFIFMNYDYNGQWDYAKGLGVGCHVNLANTTLGMATLNKAGVKPEKLVGGLANYGRSFKLEDPSCTKYGCKFTGPESGAAAGPDTKTPGMLSITEITKLSKSKADFKTRFDNDSACTIATFDGNQWVAYMKDEQVNEVKALYKLYDYQGSVLWLSNYDNNSSKPFDPGNVNSPDNVDPKDVVARYEKDILPYSDKLDKILNQAITDKQSASGKSKRADGDNGFVQFGYKAYFEENKVINEQSDEYDMHSELFEKSRAFRGDVFIQTSKQLIEDGGLPEKRDLTLLETRDIGDCTADLGKNLLVTLPTALFHAVSMVIFPGIGAADIIQDFVGDIETWVKCIIDTVVGDIADVVVDIANKVFQFLDFVEAVLNFDLFKAFDILTTDNYEAIGGAEYDEGDTMVLDEIVAEAYLEADVQAVGESIGGETNMTKPEDFCGNTCTGDDCASSNFNTLALGDSMCVHMINYVRLTEGTVATIANYHKIQADNGDPCTPVYVVNINNESPGVACNAMQYATQKGYNLINQNSFLEFTYAGGPKERDDGFADREFLRNIAPSTKKGKTYKTKETESIWERDEFPFFAMSEGKSKASDGTVTSDLSIMYVGPFDNWVDGQNANRFYKGQKPGKSKLENTKNIVKNDWTYCMPEIDGYDVKKYKRTDNGGSNKLKKGDKFIVLIRFGETLDGIDCSKYFEIPNRCTDSKGSLLPMVNTFKYPFDKKMGEVQCNKKKRDFSQVDDDDDDE